tara:strand:+ start:3477 stop:3728 length:252 start_codon:yes stop_codon:yes gene_type:complete
MLKELFANNKYVIFAGVSTLSLLISSASIISLSSSVNEISNNLETLSLWADSQNECITKTFRIDGKNTQGIPSKVWSCNGGGQ